MARPDLRRGTLPDARDGCGRVTRDGRAMATRDGTAVSGENTGPPCQGTPRDGRVGSQRHHHYRFVR